MLCAAPQDGGWLMVASSGLVPPCYRNQERFTAGSVELILSKVFVTQGSNFTCEGLCGGSEEEPVLRSIEAQRSTALRYSSWGAKWHYGLVMVPPCTLLLLCAQLQCLELTVTVDALF